MKDHFKRAYYEKAHAEEHQVMVFRRLEKNLLLQTIDHFWREHLLLLEHLRKGIHLRGYAAKNPKQEYKREAFILFEELLDRIKYQVTKVLLNLKVNFVDPSEASNQQRLTKTTQSFGRNKACYCGSGKKYKYCHGAGVS